MKVLRIPVTKLDPDPVEEIDFDRDQLWRYDVVRRIGNKVFIAERYAKIDYMASNLIAHQLADHLAGKEDPAVGVSDAVGDPSKSPAAPKEMHGPVMVAYYDRLVDRVTDLGDHDITDLTWSLKLIDPLIKVERLTKPGHDVAAPVKGPEHIATPDSRVVRRTSKPLFGAPIPKPIPIPKPPVLPKRDTPDSSGPRVG